MLKLFKRIMLLLVLLVVLTAVGFAVVLWKVDQVTRTTVEVVGSRLTKAEVQLRDVDVRLLKGEIELEMLSVGNPENFESDFTKVIQISHIDAEIAISSLMTDTMVLRKVMVKKPEILMEYSSEGSNLATIRRNVEKVTGKKKTKAGKNLVIEHLEMTDIDFRIFGGAFGKRGTRVPVSNLELHNIGKAKSDGVSSSAAIAEVMGGLMGNVGRALKDGGKVLEGNIDKFTGGTAEFLKESGKTAEDTAKSIRQGVGSFINGVKETISASNGKNEDE